jgi:hypothetical protein
MAPMGIKKSDVTRRQMLAASAGVAGGLCLGGQASLAAVAREPKPDGDGWIELFDGRTLAGWHKNPKKIVHGTGGDWHVEAGGVLAGQQDPPGSGNGGVLLTDRKFGDFELSIDIMPAWGSDSGIFLRATDQGQCIQMTVDYYEGGNIGHLYGEETGAWCPRTFSLHGTVEDGKLVKLETKDHRTPEEVGLVESCTPEQWLEAWKLNDWNTVRIRVVGEHYPVVTTSINDLPVCKFNGATSSASQYDRDTVYRTLGAAGSIAVQVHGGAQRFPAGKKCRWRHIKVREV